MGYLSDSLKTLYDRKGNRFLFAKKYTLNQLSLLIWEELGQKNMDTSTLSRVLTGQRLFTSPQLSAFCKVLELSESTIQKLRLSFQLDVASRYGISHESHHLYPDLDFLKASVTLANKLRVSSQPVMAISWIDQILATLSKYPKSKHLDTLLAEVYFEKLRCLCEISSPSQNVPVVNNMCGNLIQLGHQLNQPDNKAVGLNGLADKYYSRGDYMPALRLFVTAKSHFTNYSEEYLFNLVSSGLCISRMGKTVEFKDLANFLEKHKAKFSELHHSSLYEGLARGYGYCGDYSLANKYLEAAEKSYESTIIDTNYRNSIKKLQLLKTRFEIASMSKSHLLKRDKVLVYQQAISLAKKLNSDRYTQSLHKLSSKL